MGRMLLFVEGHGEVEAAANLVSRLWRDAGGTVPWAKPIRWKGLESPPGLERAAEFARRVADCRGVLVLRDEDDLCPATTGPHQSAQLASLRLPFPAAVALLRPEYEVLFLPCIEQLAGREIGSGSTRRSAIRAGTTWPHESWEAVRGVKEWLSRHYVRGRYKETTDQLELTRALDFKRLRAADVPSFGTLERAVGFLAAQAVTVEGAGRTYPPPST